MNQVRPDGAEHAHGPRLLREVIVLALRLGATAFGGPAAHIAMLHDEVVTRRRWLDDARFLDLLGATNLIPGPNSTEMVIHVSYLRAGWRGLVAGGVGFILPAMALVLALAWVYGRFGATVEANAVLYGIKPVVIAIVVKALWDLGRTAFKGPLTAMVGLGVLALYFSDLNEITLLFGGGFVVMVVQNARRLRETGAAGAAAVLPWIGLGLPALAGQTVSLARLFFVFLKVGAVLYGSGYVLLAFLHRDLVVRLGWLTEQQLIDAIAIGQVTPGPVFTTATFVGYLLGGFPGAVVATAGIFVPSFILVALSNPLVPRLRESPWAAGFLDGVNVASLGLMGAVTWILGQSSMVDWISVVVAMTAALLLFRFKVNTAWLILGGAMIGLLGISRPV